MYNIDIDRLVDRFLAWPLPESVNSDSCVTERGNQNRIGTNLLTATEAKQMIEYLLVDIIENIGTEQRKRMDAHKEFIGDKTCTHYSTCTKDNCPHSKANGKCLDYKIR